MQIPRNLFSLFHGPGIHNAIPIVVNLLHSQWAAHPHWESFIAESTLSVTFSLIIWKSPAVSTVLCLLPAGACVSLTCHYWLCFIRGGMHFHSVNLWGKVCWRRKTNPFRCNVLKYECKTLGYIYGIHIFYCVHTIPYVFQWCMSLCLALG